MAHRRDGTGHEWRIGEMALGTCGAEWKTALCDRAESASSVLGCHPWAISLINARTTRAMMTYHDAIIGCLLHAGFSMPMAAHATSLVDSYVHGFALQEALLSLDDAGGSSDNADVAWRRRCFDTREHVTFMAHSWCIHGAFMVHEVDLAPIRPAPIRLAPSPPSPQRSARTHPLGGKRAPGTGAHRLEICAARPLAPAAQN